MKTLFVLRHAKSSWDDPALSDFDRPLNDRGKNTAPFMGGIMSERGFKPEKILASPAVRARETARLAKEGGKLEAEITHDEHIYEASPQALAQVVASVDDAHGSVMIVGHNPGMEGFIRLLTGRLETMPTAALAVIDLDIESWQDIANGGKLRHLIRPKEERRSSAGGS